MTGRSYPVLVGTNTSAITSVWIDFNHNGVFDATEWTQIATASTRATTNVAIPATATLGVTGMRVRSRLATNPNAATDACTAFGSGETEDYLVTISRPTATRAALAGGELAVFPNPAHGAFTVEVPALASPQPGVLEVINTLGQVVRTQALAPASRATQVSVDAATLAPGIYSVRVRAGAEAAAVRLTVQ